MRKTATALAICGALMAVALPAQAAPKDPVGALKAKLMPGHGVRFTETTTWSDGTDQRQAQENKGVFEFDKKGVAAFDVTMNQIGYDEPARVISIGKTAYHSGGVLSRVLPEKKPWYKNSSGGAVPDAFVQILNPAEPTTLAALIKNGTSTKSTVTGTITFKELKKVSTWVSAARIGKNLDGTKVSYKLTLSPAGLVSKISSTFMASQDGETAIVTIDSRYTGWGGKVSVKAPDPGKVTVKLFG
jgi:hypothetical protein